MDPLSVDVPGVVEGWSRLLTRFGTISLSQAIAPAIELARDGFPVTELMAAEWATCAARLALDPAAAETFLPEGRPPVHGEIFANPRLARTLEAIADGGPLAFYEGAIARAIVADIQSRNGLLELRDFAAHRADWVDPIRTNYRSYDAARNAAQHAGLRGARDVEHHGRLRHRGHGTQFGGLPPLDRRSEEDRFRGPRRAPRRPRRDGRRYAQDADLERLRRDAAQGDRHAEGRAGLCGRRLRSPRPRRHGVSHRRRRSRERRLVDPIAVRQLRGGFRGRRHGRDAAEPGRRLHAAGQDIRTRSVRTSARCTRWCRRCC